MVERTDTTTPSRSENRFADAALARELAPALCAPLGCAWYHGTWASLHALGLVGAPERHAAFFDRVLGEAIASGQSRVLVCGTADAGMLTVVLRACDGAGVAPDVTVLDRCPTPVQVSAAYARRAGTVVDEWVCDVFDAVRPEGFDVICTHGLLAFVPDERRPQAMTRFRDLLRPGGLLVTTSSIAGPSAPDPVVFGDDAVRAYADRARQAAEATPALGVAAEDMAASAREWAERAFTHPVRSRDDMVSLLEGGGFSIVEADVMSRGGLLADNESGPWTARSGRWVEVVARRG
jgi:hypothetical protein